MSRKIILLTILFVLSLMFVSQAFACKTEEPFAFNSGEKSCPKDVQAFMDRANSCEHFGGEEPYDKARRNELVGIMDKLQCETISCDYDVLLIKYKDSKYKNILQKFVTSAHGGEDYLHKYYKCTKVNKGK